jgi:hypothetical protein
MCVYLGVGLEEGQVVGVSVAVVGVAELGQRVGA